VDTGQARLREHQIGKDGGIQSCPVNRARLERLRVGRGEDQVRPVGRLAVTPYAFHRRLERDAALDRLTRRGSFRRLDQIFSRQAHSQLLVLQRHADSRHCGRLVYRLVELVPVRAQHRKLAFNAPRHRGRGAGAVPIAQTDDAGLEFEPELAVLRRPHQGIGADHDPSALPRSQRQGLVFSQGGDESGLVHRVIEKQHRL
jgi:hypothetical protein